MSPLCSPLAESLRLRKVPLWLHRETAVTLRLYLHSPVRDHGLLPPQQAIGGVEPPSEPVNHLPLVQKPERESFCLRGGGFAEAEKL